MFDLDFLPGKLRPYLITHESDLGMETVKIMATDLNAAYNDAKSRGLRVYFTKSGKMPEDVTGMTYSFSSTGYKIVCEMRV